jgi:hypothetical protein
MGGSGRRAYPPDTPEQQLIRRDHRKPFFDGFSPFPAVYRKPNMLILLDFLAKNWRPLINGKNGE